MAESGRALTLSWYLSVVNYHLLPVAAPTTATYSVFVASLLPGFHLSWLSDLFRPDVSLSSFCIPGPQQKSKALLSRIHDDDITVDEMRRLLQLRNRDYIKAQNTKGQF